MFEEMLAKAPPGIELSTTFDADRAAAANAAQGTLTDGMCLVCNDKGYTVSVVDGRLVASECECVKRRRVTRRIRLSGLAPMLSAYTFDSYETTAEWQKKALDSAKRYVADGKGWFVIVGKPGTGKTHLCTAICGALIEAGKDVRYMLWREEAPRLKALVTDREQYDRMMDELKRCDVLYIDDFWKGTVTDADINLTFELLNARYNDERKRTIISGERSIEQILAVDEAIGSRIYQRSAGYRIKTDGGNYRLGNA